MIIGFSVKASNKILNHAATMGVIIHTDTVIYRLMDEVRNRVQALLPSVIEHRVLGEAVVQQLFKISGKKGATIHVAGCRVTNGMIERHKKVRVMRDGEEVYNGVLRCGPHDFRGSCFLKFYLSVHLGSLDALKHIKKDVLEMRKGSECGVSFENFTDVMEGDKVQTFEVVETPGKL